MIVMAVSNLAYQAPEALTARKRRGLRGLLRSHAASAASSRPADCGERAIIRQSRAMPYTLPSKHQQTLSESEARSREAGTRRKSAP